MRPSILSFLLSSSASVQKMFNISGARSCQVTYEWRRGPQRLITSAGTYLFSPVSSVLHSQRRKVNFLSCSKVFLLFPPPPNEDAVASPSLFFHAGSGSFFSLHWVCSSLEAVHAVVHIDLVIESFPPPSILGFYITVSCSFVGPYWACSAYDVVHSLIFIGLVHHWKWFIPWSSLGLFFGQCCWVRKSRNLQWLVSKIGVVCDKLKLEVIATIKFRCLRGTHL